MTFLPSRSSQRTNACSGQMGMALEEERIATRGFPRREGARASSSDVAVGCCYPGGVHWVAAVDACVRGMPEGQHDSEWPSRAVRPGGCEL